MKAVRSSLFLVAVNSNYFFKFGRNSCKKILAFFFFLCYTTEMTVNIYDESSGLEPAFIYGDICPGRYVRLVNKRQKYKKYYLIIKEEQET